MSRALLFCAAVLLLAVGGWSGWWLRGSDEAVPEVVAPARAVRQSDSSLVAERRPATPAEAKRPPHQIPLGTVEERRMSATVQPRLPDCDPVRLDLSLVREGNSRRVVASSPDGTVIDALDMPLQPALTPAPQRPWAVGALYAPARGEAGVWVERDLGRLRLGVDLVQRDSGDLAALVRVGWRF